MDEENYRQVFERINSAPCVFEKSILSLKCKCAYQHLFRLADRQGVGCTDAVMQLNCKKFLDHLRQQTRFVFKINIDGPLPHNKEIKVQNGGMLGLQKLLVNTALTESVDDIASLMHKVVDLYGGIDALPYNLIMPSVREYKTRPKRQPKNNK